MANPKDKVTDNVPGKWYVDSPKNEEEEKLSQQAMEECPVEAIGNDG